MPIYEYCCADCDTTFEKMRRMSQADDEIACPDCGGIHTSRGLSRFIAFTKGWGDTSTPVAGTVGGGCAHCGSHSCGSCGHH
jgi:putative FmdB family regulatory protein